MWASRVEGVKKSKHRVRVRTKKRRGAPRRRALKLQVSFAEYSLFYRALLHKRPTVFRSLLIVATPYHQWATPPLAPRMHVYVCVCDTSNAFPSSWIPVVQRRGGGGSFCGEGWASDKAPTNESHVMDTADVTSLNLRLRAYCFASSLPPFCVPSLASSLVSQHPNPHSRHAILDRLILGSDFPY